MEKLIFLVIAFVIYLLHEWWRARQDQAQAEDRSEPRPGQRPPAKPPAVPGGGSGPLSWEEELRRLLQGQEPSPPPASRPAAPPPVQAAPPPLPTPRRAPARAPAPVLVSHEDADMRKGLPVRMPRLEESAQAHRRASRLESSVAEHFKRVQDQVTTHLQVEVKKRVAPEVRQALGLLRDRSSQRAAIIAGVVLGPPRALES